MIEECSCSFDNFIIGSCNRSAYAAALMAIEDPGGRYHPLFIYGETGVGKTHLLRAMQGQISVTGRPAMYISGRKYPFGGLCRVVEEKLGSSDPFDDFLLIDDLQEIVRNGENIRALESLIEHYEPVTVQIVVTAVLPPIRLRTPETESFIRRLSSGFLARITPPGEATRRSMIIDELNRMNGSLTENALTLLSRFPARNLSQIRMILLRILDESEKSGPVDEQEIVKSVRRMIRSGEIEIPDGFRFSFPPAPRPAERERREKRGAGESGVQEGEEKEEFEAERSDGELDELEQKFVAIEEQISREMTEGDPGRRGEKKQQDTTGESKGDLETGLIEEWANEEDRLVDEE